VLVLANNLIHRRCAELAWRGAADCNGVDKTINGTILAALRSMFFAYLAVLFCMPFFYARQKNPLKSSCLSNVKGLAHNLIHRTCAEVGERAGGASVPGLM
jgi:hypothetical protein